MCSTVENHDLVPSSQNNPTCQAHPRVPECDGRCSVQIKSDLINRMITLSTGIQTDLPIVVHSSYRPFYHSCEPQAPFVHVPSSRSTCMRHRCLQHKLVGFCTLLPLSYYQIILIAPGGPGMSSSQQRSHSYYHHPKHFSNSHAIRCFTTTPNI